MIDDLDRTIRELLTQEMPRVARGEVDVAFQQPNRDWKRDKAALNFFLYDVRQNPTLRQHQRHELLDRENRPMRANQRIPLQRTPLRVDCFYMVTAWSGDPLDEHRLLTECLMTLARYPVLNRYELDEPQAEEQAETQTTGSAAAAVTAHGGNNRATTNGGNGTVHRTLVRDYLVGALQDLRYEIPTRLAEHDVLTNPAEVWGSLENTMKAALSYVVTLPISPWLPLDVPAVTTTRIQVGPTSQQVEINPATGLPQGSPTLRRITTYDELVNIGGVVLDALRNSEPVAGIEVQVKETGLYTRTDALGRFRFPRLWFIEQEITLVVEPHSERPTEKKVRVPHPKQADYDVTIHVVAKEGKPRRQGNKEAGRQGDKETGRQGDQ